jgi:very-short-patch-repair endonuclease
VTKAELRFYRALQKAVANDLEIFAMVRIADILTVPMQAAQRRKWLGKILAKHVDFVLCDPESLAPLLAIELDDASHDRPERKERDEFVDHAFESAGLPLLRIRNGSSYDPAALRQLIDDSLGGE